jgi:hypothetical protein
MGGASLATLLYTRGDITALVAMHSINLLVTFSLSQASALPVRVTEQRESIHAQPPSRVAVETTRGTCGAHSTYGR